MEPVIVAAIISGSVAILAPIITYVVTRMYDNRELRQIKGRQKAISGTWHGTIAQEIDGNLANINLSITFTAGKKIVEGIAEFISPMTGLPVKLNFTGGFHNDYFIKFDYTNPDETVIQFGSCIVRLSDDGKTLKGKYVGYGANTNQIVNGIVDLKKAS